MTTQGKTKTTYEPVPRRQPRCGKADRVRSVINPSADLEKNVATSKKTRKTAAPQDATAMLRADHKKVSGLFEQYEKARSTAKKAALVVTICSELKVHTQLEEEIFYPAVQAALKDHELIPEATVEHGSVKELIAQVDGKTPDGDLFDAKMKVMSEWVKHHVKEEQNEMFPRARKTRLDMRALGAKMATRKAELLASAR
jgi:hemerythrin superfamily protein